MAADIEAEEVKEDWLVTYADAITLLMAFFVMLLTFAEFDIPAYEEAVSAITKEVGKRDEASPTAELQILLQDVVFDLEADQVVEIHKDKKGLVLELAAGAFFQPGSATIREAALPVLKKMILAINAPRYDYYMVETEGHTDDDPISTDRFPSNWELSAGRASSIVRIVSSEGIGSHRLKASGYAETRPKLPNRNPDGTPIIENQALNRRVTIRVFPMSLAQREQHDIFMSQQIMEERNAPAPDDEPTEVDGQLDAQLDSAADSATSSALPADTSSQDLPQ